MLFVVNSIGMVLVWYGIGMVWFDLYVVWDLKQHNYILFVVDSIHTGPVLASRSEL